MIIIQNHSQNNNTKLKKIRIKKFNHISKQKKLRNNNLAVWIFQIKKSINNKVKI